MCPQLYINWKLKSVAAMPWRQMTYKFFNTIIDDCFAWLLPMPFLHRLSVFRDDLVFLVFLYQRWIYRTDANRANEFGISGADLEEMERRKREKERGDIAAESAAAITALVAEAGAEESKEGSAAAGSGAAEEAARDATGSDASELRQRKGRAATPATASAPT